MSFSARRIHKKHSGEPRWLQRFKIKRSRNRGMLLCTIRCKIGQHNPSCDELFEDMGSIFVGGQCSNCDDEVFREVTWIGDVWDFPTGITQSGNSTTIHHDSMLEALNLYLDDLLK